MSLVLQIALEFGKLSNEDIWTLITETKTDFWDLNTECSLYEKKMKLVNVSKAIQKRNKPYFSIEIDNDAIEYRQLANYNISCVWLEGVVSDGEDAVKWIKPFIKLDSFVHAFFYNKEYNLWQNVENPMYYESEGKKYNHLPTKYDEDGELIIDISNNPGRYELKDGYIEAIGHLMWFSPKFWKLTGSSVEKIKNSINIESAHKEGNIDIVKVRSEPFTTSEGDEGDFQQKLRLALFPYLAEK